MAAPTDEINYTGRDLAIAHHIVNEATTLSACLKRVLGIERAQMNHLLGLGAIYVDKVRVSSDVEMLQGAYLRVHQNPKRYEVGALDWASIIVEEHEEYLILDKPPGIPVHPSVDNSLENVLSSMQQNRGYPLYATHRLDVPVGGLFLLAKTSQFQRRFNKWLADRRVQKEYLALVPSLPALGRHVHFMEPSTRVPKILSTHETENSIRCELEILEAKEVRDYFEVRILLHTGRTHQIRAQLAALGAPLIGDRMYGSTLLNDSGHVALYSHHLAFPSADGSIIHFQKSPTWAAF